MENQEKDEGIRIAPVGRSVGGLLEGQENLFSHVKGGKGCGENGTSAGSSAGY